jgi:predicted glycosyl hydrolase (DUF1957 family)
VRVLDGLLNDGVDYRLTMTLSPPLVSMMTDELLVGRYHRHLDKLVELARREVDRTKRWQPHFHDLARFYLHEFSDVRRVFREVYGSNLVAAFRKHRDAGRLEIITCGATHGFFPLMDPVPQAVRAQVHVAAQHYRKHFGRDPEGIWLPECGYLPGHKFLDFLFRKMHFDQDVVKPTTPSEYLGRFGELEVCQPPMCTWGADGYAEVWLNGSNDWIYPHLDMAAERMVELVRRHEQPGGLERRALNQAARELLLAQSSDWAFIMKTNTTVEYAKKRTRDHVARFDYLYRALRGQCRLEEPIVREFEERDNVFPEIDYRVYR